MAKRLTLRKTLSQREARILVFSFIRSGDHTRDELRQLPDAEVENLLRAEGYAWGETMSSLRNDWRSLIPEFERFILTGPWIIDSNDGGGRVQITKSGAVLFDGPIGDGISIDIGYDATFDAACTARDIVIENGSIDALRTMAMKAFASLEAFFNLEAAMYNARLNASHPTLIDDGKVSLKTKLTEWLPLFGSGPINIGNSTGWESFLRLKSFRDNSAIHPKPAFNAIPIQQICDLLNDFRAIAGLLCACNSLCGYPSRRQVLRSALLPPVEIEDYDDFDN